MKYKWVRRHRVIRALNYKIENYIETHVNIKCHYIESMIKLYIIIASKMEQTDHLLSFVGCFAAC